MSQPETQEASAPQSAGTLRRGMRVGEYEIERLIGRGGMGCVYAARQPLIGKLVAIKELRGDLTRDPQLVRRFVEEARAVNRIGHPNIIDIFAFGELCDGRQYYVMELLAGQSLRERMDEGPLPLPLVERCMEDVCSALTAAHAAQIVHRDLKPENIWLVRSNRGGASAKLLDFGIAKLLGEQSDEPLTELGTVIGTPPYMSPEQCQGGALDARSDVYALGVILYEIVAGRLPFEGNSLHVLTQHLTAPPPPLPPGTGTLLAELIMACLEKDCARRPASAREVGQRLAVAVLAAGGTVERAIGELPTLPSGPPPRAAGAKRSVGMLAVVAALLLLAIAAMKTLQTADVQPRAQEPPPLPPPKAAVFPTTPAPAPMPHVVTQPVANPSVTPAAVRSTPSRAARRGLVTTNPFRQ